MRVTVLEDFFIGSEFDSEGLEDLPDPDGIRRTCIQKELKDRLNRLFYEEEDHHLRDLIDFDLVARLGILD